MSVKLYSQLVPSPMIRRGMPYHKLVNMQIPFIIQTQLKTLLDVIDYLFSSNLPVHLGVYGQSGFGKSSLLARLLKYLNELYNHKWEIAEYWYLSHAVQLTGPFMTKKHKPYQIIAIDEAPLLINAANPDRKIIEDVLEFLNTMREEKIGAFFIAQEREELQKFIRDKLPIELYVTFNNVQDRFVTANVDLRIKELGGKWGTDYHEFQALKIGWCHPKDHEFISKLKKRTTRSIEGMEEDYNADQRDIKQGVKGIRVKEIMKWYKKDWLTKLEALWLLTDVRTNKNERRGLLGLTRADHEWQAAGELEWKTMKEEGKIPKRIRGFQEKITELLRKKGY